MKAMEQLIERAARDLVNSKYAIALTGAGISTESVIRDFRGPQGVWTLNPEAERRAYSGYQRFLEDPLAEDIIKGTFSKKRDKKEDKDKPLKIKATRKGEELKFE